MINVIIPAYNCSKTLGRTLASLVAQTDQNFEVIIVDDCSTENIKNIIDDYNNKLKIIYISNEKNIGCGMSRQVGIDNATQKFITFLDSDDYVEKNIYKEMYELAKKENSDMVECDFLWEYPNKTREDIGQVYNGKKKC